MIQSSVTMYVCATAAAAILVFFLVLYEIYLRSLPSYRAAKFFPGYPVYPIVQNLFTALFQSQTGSFQQARQWARTFNNRTYCLLIKGVLFVQVIHYKDVEMLLSSSRLITKSPLYKLTVPFIGKGLLNSTGEKWHQRRKILTPTFHFNILQGFLQIFHDECQKLVNELDEDSARGVTTTLQPLSTQVTLNTICETAMGLKLDTSEAAELYKRNIREVGIIIEQRIMNPLLFEDWIYKIMGYQAKFDQILRPIHAFTKNIIRQRRETFRETMENSSDSASEENRYTNVKQRYAMLDSLLLAEAKQQIDAEGIREEVDTFTFEGHDTTGSAFVFIFLLIAHDQTVQQRLFEEVLSMFNNQPNPTLQDYNDLKYMDRVIKESLRIYPPVPFISRSITEDVHYDGKFVPKGSIMSVEIYDLHRDPEQFPDPERFDPDRFLPEQVQRRSPYAYIPFSAGPRNCIETAMGVKLDSMSMADEYRAKIQEVVKLLLLRVMNPWLVEEFPYRLLGFRARLMKLLKPIHAFTRSIIKQRRNLFHANVKNVDDFSEENIYMNTNQRYALLDTLLASEAKNQIDEEGIREEVDTFMFEGHDTTASAFTFIFLVIANHQEAQRQLVEEIETMLAGRSNPEEHLSIQDYGELKYMDRVIKECLRLYPPVPFIGRAILEDAWFGDRFVPKDSMANVHIYDLHRDPDQFPDPERFDPDRFLPANVEKRNPYAYVPFSAGPRNCIGQRFAMLELKAILAAVLREFRVLPVTKREDVVFVADMVLRSRDPIVVKFERR